MLGALFGFAVLASIPANIIAWWNFAHVAQHEWPSVSRRRITTAGLLANSLTIAYPWLAFLTSYVSLNYGTTLGISPNAGGFPIFNILGVSSLTVIIVDGFLLGVISAITGALAPRCVRVPLLCAGVAASCFWFILPSGSGFL
jgi:hypothetical protein